MCESSSSTSSSLPFAPALSPPRNHLRSSSTKLLFLSSSAYPSIMIGALIAMHELPFPSPTPPCRTESTPAGQIKFPTRNFGRGANRTHDHSTLYNPRRSPQSCPNPQPSPQAHLHHPSPPWPTTRNSLVMVHPPRAMTFTTQSPRCRLVAMPELVSAP